MQICVLRISLNAGSQSIRHSAKCRHGETNGVRVPAGRDVRETSKSKYN